MKAYHIDRDNRLRNLKTINLSPVPSNWGNYDILKERYPEGLSQWGKTILGLENTGIIDLTYIENKKPYHTSYMIDLLFEYERLASYNNKHSRFQSIFAARSFEEAKKWAEIIPGKNNPIYEIEFDSTQALELDPSYLKAELNKFKLTDIQQNAHIYWSGQRSANPNVANELLIKLPVKINRLVNGPMLHIHKI